MWWRARGTRRCSTSPGGTCRSTTPRSSRSCWRRWGQTGGRGDLQEGTRSEVVRRLRSVEGHVRGVEKMVEEGDVTYADIVQQTSAIFSAIRRINTVLLKDFVEERAGRDGASAEMIKDLVKAIDRVTK
ncbi:metal-sensing transcriptional repressor [Rubrobacter tropicus]|uniref:Metal-sensing transcriptional repressor n=1 Tax=Rubrobacter tropicus TaxID=2653851 RepID=A0A6G8Q6P3_9ACTN|nr:metal-sensing transcriptional repressor [Rubrobacter tropicus]